MRLRNIPGATEEIDNSRYCVNDAPSHKGKWASQFAKEAPIHIEIGMGKGQFLTTLASQNPDINYIGIEKYDSVLLRALQKMEDLELDNILFIRMNAEDLNDVFASEEIDKIYLNFSDPWPKDRHAKRRLTSHQFLDRYDQCLKKDGYLEFKTDNADLFQFSLEEVEGSKWKLDAHTFDLHHDDTMNVGNVMTEYEQKFSELGNPIHKMIISR